MFFAIIQTNNFQSLIFLSSKNIHVCAFSVLRFFQIKKNYTFPLLLPSTIYQFWHFFLQTFFSPLNRLLIFVLLFCFLNTIYFILFSDPPIVTLRLGSTLSADDIKEGDDVYFECHVQANPQWRKLYWLHDVSKLYINVKFSVFLAYKNRYHINLLTIVTILRNKKKYLK